MKKGLIILIIMAFTLVGMVSFAASPKLWGIPDIVIGDNEDQGVTDNFFVFTDAIGFADYWHWYESDLTGLNAGGLKWLYTDATDDNAIAINATTVSEVINIAGGGKTSATFRNIRITPFTGGPYVVGPGTTDPVIVELAVDNFLVRDTQNITVYTVDGSSDALTNEYYTVTRDSEDFTGDPELDGWQYLDVGILDPGTVPPFGVRPAVGSYIASSDAIAIETTGWDNDFGWWQMPADTIEWVDGAAYVFTMNLISRPITQNQDPNWQHYVPRIRMRVNTGNETVSQEWEAQAMNMGSIEITSDQATGTTETTVFDPRDHSSYVPLNLDYLYFSFDLIDFSATNRFFIGQKDEEGLVALRSLTIDTFPIKMIDKSSTLAYTYPDDFTTGTWTWAIHNGKLLVQENGFGGTPIDATTDSASGALLLDDGGVTAGISLYQLVSTGDGLKIINHPDKWFRYKFYCTASNQDAHWMRLRVFLMDGERSTNYNVTRPNAFVSGYQLPLSSSPDFAEVYNVFLCPSVADAAGYASKQVMFAFDHIDFAGDYGNSALGLCKVEAFAATPPTPTP